MEVDLFEILNSSFDKNVFLNLPIETLAEFFIMFVNSRHLFSIELFLLELMKLYIS